MASSGVDGQLKLWDVRTHSPLPLALALTLTLTLTLTLNPDQVRTYRPLHSYFAPRTATDLDFSDRGLLAAVHGPTVQVLHGVGVGVGVALPAIVQICKGY